MQLVQDEVPDEKKTLKRLGFLGSYNLVGDLGALIREDAVKVITDGYKCRQIE